MVPGDGRSGSGDESDIESTAHEVEDAAERTEHAVEGAKQTVEAVEALARGGSVQDVARNLGGLAQGAGAVTGALSGSDAASSVTNAVTQSPEARGLANGVISAASTVQSVARVIESVAEIAEEMGAGSGRELPVVRYAFSSDGDKSTTWRVFKVRVTEALSDLYEGILELANEELDADPDKLLGQSCEFTASREDTVRRLCGIVHRVEHLGTRAGHLICRVRVAPALAALGQRVNSRIFQEMGADEIVQKVLKEGLDPFERKFELDLARPPLKREYCVQYQEADLAFVRRLLEDEGIAFYFDHSASSEKMVMVSANSAYQKVTTMDGNAIAIAGAEQETASVETVRHFDWSNSLQSTSVVVRDFDWTQPLLDLTREVRGKDDQQHDREVFLYPGDPTIGGYDNGSHRYTREDTQTVTRVERERHKMAEKTANGQSNVTGFTPGYTFEVSGHGRAALDGEYLLTRVEHEGEAAEQLTSDSHEHGNRARYTNRFECIPNAVPYRPAKVTPREIVHGIQTATVVGPSSEEIYTDFHGRIKVQFHWDREGKNDEKSSCWVRVAQTWGGSGWGFVFIPRIGMEVVVDFLEGDPDKPLVVGCVYNGTHNTPYELDGAKTKSTIRTQSTPGNDPSKFNELRFEDAAGSEEVFIHAQKDFNEVVLHDHTTTVSANQTISVGGDQAITVTGEETETVHKNQALTVDKNRTVHVKGSQSTKVDGGMAADGVNGSKLVVTGDWKADVSNTIEFQAPTHIKFTCGGSTVTLEPGKITLSAGGSAQVVLDANALMKSAAGTQVFLDANALVQASGGAKVLFDGNANMTSAAGSQVLLDANAKMSSTGGSLVKLDGNATVSTPANASLAGGATAKVSAPTSTLAGGGGSVEAGGAGVTAAGGQVNVSGGMVNISGGLVKIN